MRLRKGAVLTLFILYLTGLFILLFFRTPFQYAQINLRPFATIGSCMRLLHSRESYARPFRRYAAVNLAGNLFLFFPLGIFAANLKKRPCPAFLFLPLSAAIIFTVELIQGITRLGAFDVDDLILNLAGCWLAYVLSARNRKRRQNIE